jgi:hypothetical protein
VRRWLLALLGLLIAVGAFYLLLSPGDPVMQGELEHDQIDAESRAKLREVLREEREP